MPIESTTLPDHILRKMSPADRKKLGAAGLTAGEATAKALAGEEIALQDQIGSLLRQRDVPYIQPNPKRKSPLPEGWPDFTFTYRGVPFVVEVKTAVGTLSAEQAKLHPQLARAGWRVRVVRGLGEFRALLEEVDAAL